MIKIDFKRFALIETIMENKALSISTGVTLLTFIVLGFMGYLDDLVAGIFAIITILLLGVFGALATLIPVIFGLGLYCLPIIIGLIKNRTDINLIILVNLLLGWTLIGWIIVLIWAFTDNTND